MSELAAKVAAACLCHVVGEDGKNCRNCGISAAWIEERNHWNASTYRVPGAWPRRTIDINGCPHVHLSMQPIPLMPNGWIEVVW